MSQRFPTTSPNSRDPRNGKLPLLTDCEQIRLHSKLFLKVLNIKEMTFV